MSRALSEYQERAEKAVKESASRPDFIYSGSLPIGQTWALTISKHRDSGLLDQSNYDRIKADLEERFPRDVAEERFQHFAVGWIDELAVRMLGRDGKVTRAGIAALQWADELANYPVADEEDYSRREYETTIQNIRFEGGLDGETAKKVYGWLSKNSPVALQSETDRGGYPLREEIERALVALGLSKGDEAFTQTYDDPPEQMRLWPNQ